MTLSTILTRLVVIAVSELVHEIHVISEIIPSLLRMFSQPTGSGRPNPINLCGDERVSLDALDLMHMCAVCTSLGQGVLLHSPQGDMIRDPHLSLNNYANCISLDLSKAHITIILGKHAVMSYLR